VWSISNSLCYVIVKVYDRIAVSQSTRIKVSVTVTVRTTVLLSRYLNNDKVTRCKTRLRT